MSDVTRIFLPRRGRKVTMENDQKKNTVLSEGELFVECSNDGIGKGFGRLKMGDGSTPYEQLPYLLGDSNNTPVEFTEDSSATSSEAIVKVNSGAMLSDIIASFKQAITLSNTEMSNQKYAGSATPNGPATSAVKLETVRKIGNADFDGSADITLTQIGAQAAGSYAAASHTHDNVDINNLDAAKITTGTIDIARLPAGSLERLVIVANDTARYALTENDVQVGDTVKVSATGLMYFVVDSSKLSSANGYVEYTAGAATSATQLATARKIGNASFNGTADITLAQIGAQAAGSYAAASHTHTASQVTGDFDFGSED